MLWAGTKEIFFFTFKINIFYSLPGDSMEKDKQHMNIESIVKQFQCTNRARESTSQT